MISTTHRSLSIVVRTSFSHRKSGTRSEDLFLMYASHVLLFTTASLERSPFTTVQLTSYVGLAFTKLDEIVDYIKSHSVVTTSDTEIGRR